MPVQQHVLNWLYSVLTSEYQDVNRTYNDVAQALARYPTLTPRTDVFTFPNGSSALLVHMSGTLPVNFRGSVYRFPVSVWIPHAYPREPPTTYVTPTDTMMVRPGQHVDPQGQIYHPYLARWAEFWDKSTLHDFLAVLCDVFAKEPPVVARQQSRASQSPQPVQSPPPVPPLPPEMGGAPARQQSASIGNQSSPRPPPPPPKTHHSGQAHPQPPQRPGSGFQQPPTAATPNDPAGHRLSRYDSAPPLPPQAYGSPAPPQTPHQQHPPRQDPSLAHRQPPPHLMAAGPVAYQGHPQGYPQGPPQEARPVPQWQPPTQQPPPAWAMQQAPQQAPQPVQPPPDLMDGPLTLDIPKDAVVAAPPIPPNPEKDMLLGQLAQVLASMRQTSRQQNESSMAGLHAQRVAMANVMPVMQAEIGQLNQLSNLLASNTSILRESLHKADAVIEGSRSQPAPDIDELLVAPTVVSNQLYQLVAEERALGDAIFMLGRAVERGRIAPAVFSKTTRQLAREWYLKKALVRKIGEGMGLASA